MSHDLKAVVIPKDFYYHEVVYVKNIEDNLINAMAELIYLRLYGKDGTRWEANESKGVWIEKAKDQLKGIIR